MKQKLLFLTLTVALALPAALPQAAHAQATNATEATEARDLPRAYTLSPAYPNPFNPRTSFTLTVRERQEVTIEVFNLLGISVKRLFSGVMEAGETQTFTFEADDLPSGIYLYRARGEHFTATRQVTLLK